RTCKLPTEHQRNQSQGESNETRLPSADAICQQAHDGPEERPSQQGQSNEKSFLCCCELQRVADKRSERSQNHPHHETDIEVEKRRQQRRRVASLPESAQSHAATP